MVPRGFEIREEWDSRRFGIRSGGGEVFGGGWKLDTGLGCLVWVERWLFRLVSQARGDVRR